MWLDALPPVSRAFGSAALLARRSARSSMRHLLTLKTFAIIQRES